MRIFSTFSKRWVELVKTADEKVPDQAVEKTCVVTEQDGKAVTQAIARLVGDEGQVGRHNYFLQFLTRLSRNQKGNLKIQKVENFKNALIDGCNIHLFLNILKRKFQEELLGGKIFNL